MNKLIILYNIDNTNLTQHDLNIINNYTSIKRKIYEYNQYTKYYFESIKSIEFYTLFEPFLNVEILEISRINFFLLPNDIKLKLYNFPIIDIASKRSKREKINITTSEYNDFPKKLKLEEIHNYSKGKNIKIGIIDTGFPTDFVSLKFYDNNNSDHGNFISNIIKNNSISISPESLPFGVTISEFNGPNKILVLLGIIACTLNKCQIINISQNIIFESDELNSIYNDLSDIINKNNHLNVVIVISAGNDRKSIQKNTLTNIWNFICIGGFADKLQLTSTNTGPQVDIFMPNYFKSHSGNSISTAFFSGMLANYYSFLQCNKFSYPKISNLLLSNRMPLNNNLKNYYTFDFGNLFINSIKSITMSTKKHVTIKRTKGSDISYLKMGIIDTKCDSVRNASGYISYNGVKIDFNATRDRDKLEKDNTVYFLEANPPSNNPIATNIILIDNPTQFNIDNIAIYAPHRTSTPNGQGTVSDDKPGQNLTGQKEYYIVTNEGSLILCTSEINLKEGDFIYYDIKNSLIKQIDGFWSDENP